MVAFESMSTDVYTVVASVINDSGAQLLAAVALVLIAFGMLRWIRGL